MKHWNTLSPTRPVYVTDPMVPISYSLRWTRWVWFLWTIIIPIFEKTSQIISIAYNTNIFLIFSEDTKTRTAARPTLDRDCWDLACWTDQKVMNSLLWIALNCWPRPSLANTVLANSLGLFSNESMNFLSWNMRPWSSKLSEYDIFITKSSFTDDMMFPGCARCSILEQAPCPDGYYTFLLFLRLLLILEHWRHSMDISITDSINARIPVRVNSCVAQLPSRWERLLPDVWNIWIFQNFRINVRPFGRPKSTELWQKRIANAISVL